MSISVAVTELKKELAVLDKTIEDAEKKKAPILAALQSLQQRDAKSAIGALARKGKPGPKPGAKKPGPKPGTKKAIAKKGTAKKAAVVPETTAPKKRVMSAEAKARIGAAAKKRWAAKKAAEKKA